MKYLRYLIFCTLTFGLSKVAYSFQTASVISDNAIIYADPYLKVPIGTLSLGKEIIVSDESVNHGKSYILSLKEKVAYMKTEDLLTETMVKEGHRLKTLKSSSDYQHPVRDILEKETEDDFTINNYLILETGATGFKGGDWDKYNSIFLDRTPPITHDFSAYIQHAPMIHSHSVSIGISYLTQEDSRSSLSALLFIGELNLEIIENSFFNIALGFSGYIAPEMQIKLGSPLERFTGNAFGAGPRLSINFFPHSKFGLHITGRYQYYQTVGFQNMNINNISQPISFDEFSNFSVTAGLRFRVL